MNDTEIRNLIKDFMDANYNKFGSHSYNVGYFESMVFHLLTEVPEKTRDNWLSNMYGCLKQKVA